MDSLPFGDVGIAAGDPSPIRKRGAHSSAYWRAFPRFVVSSLAYRRDRVLHPPGCGPHRLQRFPRTYLAFVNGFLIRDTKAGDNRYGTVWDSA